MIARTRLGLAALCLLSGSTLASVASGCGGDDSGSAATNPDVDGGSTSSSSGSSGEGGSSGGEGGGSSGEAGADAAPAPGPGELGAGYVDYAINHILSTGQSNSVANGGSPPVTTAAGPYTNLSFDTGVMPMGGCDGEGCTQWQTPAAFVPLKEGDNFFDYAVETASSGIANEISKIATDTYHFGAKAGVPAKHDTLVSLHGRSGNTYWCLRKNSCNYHAATDIKPFTQGMMEVQAAKQIAAAHGLSYTVRAVTAIHGESDHYGYVYGTPEFPLDGTDGSSKTIKDYSDALIEWQRDYDTEVKAITAQKNDIPLLVSQLSGWTTTATAEISQMQLSAHTRAPGKVVLVTPTYMLPVREDCLHFDANGQRRLGEYFAKAYARIVFQGLAWEPLRPASITRAGAVITVKLLVPKPPLVIDTTQVTQATNYGFDVVDAAGNLVAVSKVALAGTDSVTLTLAAEPTTALTVRYAQNQATGSCIGPGLAYSGGARGNIHDSDDAPSQYGYDLTNWLVSFTLPVN